MLTDLTRDHPSPELAAWLSSPDPKTFPYDAVVTEFHRVGKHFVADELLGLLDGVRAMLPGGSDPGSRLLARFLDIALDKWDGRYDNPSYLAVDLLPLPGTGDGSAAWQRDRLLALLVADTLRFEVAAADRRTILLPQMRPDARITAKRCRLGVRAVAPALARLGLAVDATANDPLTAARHVCRVVADDLQPAETRTLRLTMLPVSLVHDEYMFIRMLQSYETTFALMAVELAAAATTLEDGHASAAVRAITAAERALREAAPLWSLVATVQQEAFLSFREFTEGASAIQSRSYKRVESLCRRPDRSRLDSAAYRSVPDVRAGVLAGQPNLDEMLTAAHASGRLAPDEYDRVRSAMQRLEAALLKWRQTHYRLAVQMLGERRGTGYTEGVPYLEKTRRLPVFTSTSSPLATRRLAFGG
jgi:tryptophan 2,3-dioxygenase